MAAEPWEPGDGEFQAADAAAATTAAFGSNLRTGPEGDVAVKPAITYTSDHMCGQVCHMRLRSRTPSDLT